MDVTLNKDQKREDISVEYILNETPINMNCSLEEKEYILTGVNSLNVEENDPFEEDFYKEELIKELITNVNIKRNEELLTTEHIFTEELSHPRQLLELRKELFSSSFILSIDHRIIPLSPLVINDLIKRGGRDELIQALQEFDPKITGIELLMDKVSQQRNVATPYIQHETLGLVPISMFGDGIRKAVLIASRIILSRNSVLLIDEIETGIHTKLIPTFFEWISNMCEKYNVQLFATTHSLEALDGMLHANLDDVNRLTVYRLEDSVENTKIKHFSGEKLKKLRYTLGQDVR